MTEEKDESMMLSRMRTLLALERNFLAEERTCLAEFRTGLAIILIGPPTSIIIFQISSKLWMNIILYIFLGTLMIWGAFMMFKAHKKVNKLRNERKIVKDKEKKIIESSPTAQELLENCMFKTDFCED
ncbi:MAG: hypothetical protein ACTSRX_02800 [Promethearchaeota archaeon]